MRDGLSNRVSPILRQFLLLLPLWAGAQVCGPLKRALL